MVVNGGRQRLTGDVHRPQTRVESSQWTTSSPLSDISTGPSLVVPTRTATDVSASSGIACNLRGKYPMKTTDHPEGGVAVITGAGGAIGRASALRFGADGYRLVLTDVDELRLDETVLTCNDVGIESLHAACDLTDSGAAVQLITLAVERFGRVDALLNIAGAWPTAKVADMSDELWDRVLAVNLSAVFYTCRAAIPTLVESGGVIVNIASGSAYVPIEGLAGYSAAKGGLISFGRVLSLELAPRVRVCTVSPGPTTTPTNDLNDPEAVRLLRAVEGSIPLGRLAEPAEIADAISFVASDGARFMTGTVVHVNGGRLMM